MDQNRRAFIRAGGGAFAGAALVVPGIVHAGTVTPAAVKLAFESTGEMPFAPGAPLWVLSPGPPPPQLLDALPLLYDGTIKLVVKQCMKDLVVNTQVLIMPGPNYNADIFPLPPFGYIPISDFDVLVSSVTLGKSGPGKYNFAVAGQVTRTNVPSPFGELVGRAASFTAEFDTTGETSFYFAGGFVAGSHSTWVPFATGKLSVNSSAA